jgi:hypothetical protein
MRVADRCRLVAVAALAVPGVQVHDDDRTRTGSVAHSLPTPQDCLVVQDAGYCTTPFGAGQAATIERKKVGGSE